MNRLLPIAVVAFVAASLAIFLFGDSGLTAFRGLAGYERSLEANVESLKQRNRDLGDQLARLKADRESTVVLARGIGMYEPGDAVVKLAGRPAGTVSYAVGDLLHLRRPDPVRNTRFKEAALGAAAVLVLVAYFATRAARRKANGPSRR